MDIPLTAKTRRRKGFLTIPSSLSLGAFVAIICFILLHGCHPDKDLKFVQFRGEAQGTYFAVSYYSPDGISYYPQIDSLLKDFDQTASVYQPASIISMINRNDTTVTLNEQFIDLFNQSKQISRKTNGAFDITVGPLVNAWGFGFKNKIQLDPKKVDSLKELVNYQGIEIVNGKVIKKDPRMELDMNAIAQGYCVDLICQFLESKGIDIFLVDIGGEVKGKGKKPDGSPWKVGIEKPAENQYDERDIEAIIQLENKAVATSGNYRKFYMDNGIRYSHTIDPATGMPVRHSLLSVSVLASSCAIADGYATAFMVMGLEEAKAFLAAGTDMEAYFIFSEKDGKIKAWATPGMRSLILPE
ncbi:MAG: FAD:protein FMN transferase [Bacteroidetes bacterium]|nr:FAD:protein FMN transferase [Bacteroidota bacterium]